MAPDDTARDIGDLLHVPAEERLYVDPPPGQAPEDYAAAGGVDDDLDDVYANPDRHA